MVAGTSSAEADELVAQSIATSKTRPRLAPVSGNVPWRCRQSHAEALAAGDENVLTAVVVERFPIESAVESFQTQARDVEETQPFVLGCPPERTGSTVVQGDVDSVIADAVVVRVRQGYSGVRVCVPAV